MLLQQYNASPGKIEASFVTNQELKIKLVVKQRIPREFACGNISLYRAFGAKGRPDRYACALASTMCVVSQGSGVPITDTILPSCSQ